MEKFSNMAKMRKILWMIHLPYILLGSTGQVSAARTSTPESLYASSLYRNERRLTNVTELARIDNLSGLHKCLMHCLQLKSICKSFNYAENGTCILLSESLCADDDYELVEDENFSYYDLMSTPDYEKKHLVDDYCRVYGKCSGLCYPRKRKRFFMIFFLQTFLLFYVVL